MNLYKILISHYSPRDDVFRNTVLLLSKTDKQVSEYIKYQLGIVDTTFFNHQLICEDNVDICNVYYGNTLYGWEMVKENVTTDYSELIELGEIIKIC